MVFLPMTNEATPAVRRSRGMRDLLPADMRAFRRVEDAFRAAASGWGYEEVRTPHRDVRSFTTAGALTPQMLSRVYSFLDWDGWSGERVVLRPDSTIPVSRAASEAAIELPARLFYVQNVFRFSESGDREDWQCGLEYLGAAPSLGDLEVAAVACETLEALGLKPRYGSDTSAWPGDCGVAGSGRERRPARAARPGGRGRAGALPGTLAPAGSPVGALIEVAMRGAVPGLLENIAGLARAALPEALPALEEARVVAEALAATGGDSGGDLGMPRDFEYYTGVVFEFEAGGEGWGAAAATRPARARASTACGLGLDAGRLAGRVAKGTRRRLTVSIHPELPSDMGRAMAMARALHRSGIAAALGGATDRWGSRYGSRATAGGA